MSAARSGSGLVVAALTPIGTDGWLAARHPFARVVAATLPGLVLVVTLDALTPALVLLATVLALPVLGVPVGPLVRRGWPLLVTVTVVALVNALYSPASGGRVLLDLGPLRVTSEAALAGLGVGLRVAGIALPGFVVVATLEPRDLADAMVESGRVPPRFAYGALAALRLLPLVAQEWGTLGQARRARGVSAGGNPLTACRLLLARVTGLLVAAVRRATRLARALDARGVGAPGPRTVARPQPWTGADTLLVLGTAALVAAAVAVSVVLGTWDPLVSL